MKPPFRIVRHPLALSCLLAMPLLAHAADDPLASITAQAPGVSSVPAILGYAQQQVEQKQSSPAKQSNTNKPKHSTKTAAENPLQEKFSQQQTWLTQKDETIRQLQAQLEAKTHTAADVSNQVAQLQAQLNHATSGQQTQQQLSAQIDALQKQSQQDKKQQVAAAQNEQLLAGQLDALKLQTKNDKDALKSKADELEKLNAQMANLKQATQKQTAAAQNEQQLAGQLDALKLQAKNDKDALKSKADELEKLNAQMANLKQETQKQTAAAQNEQLLAGQLDALKLQAKNDKDALKSKADELEKLNAQMANLKQETQKQTAAAQNEQLLAGQLDALKLQAKNDKDALKSKADELEKLTAQMANLKQETQKQTAAVQNEQQLAGQLDALKLQAKNDKDALKSKADELEKLNAQVTSLKQEQVTNLKQEVLKQTAIAQNMQLLSGQLDALKLQAKNDKDALKSKADELEKLNAQMANLKQETQKQTATAQNEQLLAGQLDALKLQAKNDKDALKSKADELEKLNAQMANLKQEAQQQTVATQNDEDALKLKADELEKLTALVVSLKQETQQQAATAQDDKNILKSKTDELEKLTAQIVTLKQEAQKQTAAVDLKKIPQQQAYSVGVSLGGDVIEELTARESQGVRMDRNAVLQGIHDVFVGKLALDENSRNKALAGASQAVYQNLNKIEVKTTNAGKLYQEKFSKLKNVEFKDGVYSRVNYQGQEPLNEDDNVTVVMKETLTDGTVISDMEASGKVWTQPLSAYPSIFRGPLMRLGNHGSITIVVPPELAYGSKGLAPKIPPGATMTYNVRIVDVEKSK